MTRAALFALLAALLCGRCQLHEAGPDKPTPMTIEQPGCCDRLQEAPK